jgi:hypothetical protein
MDLEFRSANKRITDAIERCGRKLYDLDVHYVKSVGEHIAKLKETLKEIYIDYEDTKEAERNGNAEEVKAFGDDLCERLVAAYERNMREIISSLQERS